MNKVTKVPWGTVGTEDYYGGYETILDSKAHSMKIYKYISIKVLWPDKTTTVEKLGIDYGEDSVQIDRINEPEYFKTRSLYIIHNIHGKKIKISLRGMKVGVLV